MVDLVNSVLSLLKSTLDGLVSEFYNGSGSVRDFAFMTIIVMLFPMLLSIIVNFIIILVNRRHSENVYTSSSTDLSDTSKLSSRLLKSLSFRFLFPFVHKLIFKSSVTGDGSFGKVFAPRFIGSALFHKDKKVKEDLNVINVEGSKYGTMSSSEDLYFSGLSEDNQYKSSGVGLDSPVISSDSSSGSVSTSGYSLPDVNTSGYSTDGWSNYNVDGVNFNSSSKSGGS